jgi:uncharacterized protein (TIGR02145 family)
MNKLLFFFLSLFASTTMFAQTTVQILSTDFAAKKATFSVSWTTAYNNKIWVIIDYRTVEGTTQVGDWTRATIASATVTAGIGSAATAPETNRGFWINGVTGTASATVTATLGNELPAKFNWCAYANDYPPNMTYVDGNYAFKGTPPFTVKPASGTATLTLNEKTYPYTSFTWIPTTLTDATDCPGIVNWVGCSLNTVNLGTVGFTSAQTWVVGSQTWSAPVTATYCNKSTYVNDSDPYKADCRNNSTASYGHLFSWCLVATYAAQLCPAPWRVPTRDDFCTLDKFLFSTATCENRLSSSGYTKYTSNVWGGALSGRSYQDGSLHGGSNDGYLFALSANAGYNSVAAMTYGISGINPAWTYDTQHACTIRCVK